MNRLIFSIGFVTAIIGLGIVAMQWITNQANPINTNVAVGAIMRFLA